MQKLTEPKQKDEILEGYLDGFSDDRDMLPVSLQNRSESYRHGWQNGRDDRLVRPRMSAQDLRHSAEIARLNDQFK